MNGQTSEALLSLFDSTRLRPRYWVDFSLLSLITVLEFFDFAIVAFLFAGIGPQWHLTYRAVRYHSVQRRCRRDLRRVAWGSLSDAWGRKSHLVLGTFICGIGAGAIGLEPWCKCHVALRRRLRPDRGGDAMSHTRRRSTPDALPACCVRLLCCVRNRRRAAGPPRPRRHC